jgi:outer membrane receptor protein involved in Fe transport
MGLNVALPAEWAAQISYSETRDSNWVNTVGSANKAAVSAALGWTIQPSAASGTAPSFGAWTKPATVPYLNLFCDPYEFQCNSPGTLDYIGNFNRSDEAFWVNEKSVKADGPLFDLPGGTVKAAIGASYFSNKYIIEQQSQNPNNTVVQLGQDPQGRNVWAVYAQLSVPVFSDQNAIVGFRRLDFEFSWRHDQYSDFGGTSNQKVGFNWSPIEDWTIRGGYGTSFRAPNFGENSLLVNAAWNGFGIQSVFPNNNAVTIACTGGSPVPGSGSEKLFNAGFGCNSQPGGMTFLGGAKAPNTAGWRDYFNTDGQVLKPEQSLNWAATLDYAPTNNFLTGLNLTATWYSIKITSLLASFGNTTTGRFADGALGFAYIVPSDLRDPGPGGRGHIDGFNAGDQLCPGMDLTPQLCAPLPGHDKNRDQPTQQHGPAHRPDFDLLAQ